MFFVVWLILHFKYGNHTVLDIRMTDEIRTGKDLDGSGCGPIDVLSQHLPEGLRQTLKNLSDNNRSPVRNLNGVSLECYLQISPFGLYLCASYIKCS
jgi:hypothetical protein